MSEKCRERVGLETTKIFSDSAPHTLPHRQSLVSPSQRAIRPRIKEAPTYPRNRPTAAPPHLHCSSRQIGWGALREAPSPSPHARRVAHASSDALFARHDIPPQRKAAMPYKQAATRRASKHSAPAAISNRKELSNRTSRSRPRRGSSRCRRTAGGRCRSGRGRSPGPATPRGKTSCRASRGGRC